MRRTDYFTREPDNAHEFWMDETLNRTLLDFYRHRKPMGFLSLASLLAARVFQGVHITLCDEATRQSDLVILDRFLATGERTGATLVNRNIFQALHDTNYHIYSSPGSMTTAIPPERIYYNISEGIGNLVDQMVQSL
uniref:Uncharacterized protein n=1 Tax=Trichogramma kaykai TaxID=54128 RepID=A0ABD2WVM1_9HYME